MDFALIDGYILAVWSKWSMSVNSNPNLSSWMLSNYWKDKIANASSRNEIWRTLQKFRRTTYKRKPIYKRQIIMSNCSSALQHNDWICTNARLNVSFFIISNCCFIYVPFNSPRINVRRSAQISGAVAVLFCQNADLSSEKTRWNQGPTKSTKQARWACFKKLSKLNWNINICSSETSVVERGSGHY